MNSLFKNLPLCLLLLGVAACDNQQNDEESIVDTQQTSDVLATVNGEGITQADVDFMIERTFSSVDQVFFDETMQGKVLESLVASKAMQQEVIKTLSADELSTIEKKTRAYKEELFVKEYLVQNATPVPVSTRMVNDYYQSNQDEFGGGEARVFEMLAPSRKPDEPTRDAILKAVSKIKANNDWVAFAQTNTLGLLRKSATMRPGLLEPGLERALSTLKKGQVSDVVFIKGVPHVLRVLNVKTLPAQPLSTVSAKIRKKLAGIQLKKAVKKASDDVIKRANVELK